MTSSPERSRRRLDKKEDPGPRAGCIVTGALLGIIVGATFAFYGLPPILRSIYGETTIAYGGVYNAEARRIEVLHSQRIDDEFQVELQVRSNRTWDLDHTDWSLEISTQSSWIEALPPDPAMPETSMEFPLGEERTLLLRFPTPMRVDAEMEKLHLSQPRVAFELRPPEAAE